jgi:predicted nuclease with TOPRIM domain
MAKLDDIISIADKAYSTDDLVQLAAAGQKPGDMLAEFIATELRETFDRTVDTVEHLKEAMRTMDMARRQLEDVRQAFSEALIQCKKIKNARDLPLLIGKFTSPIAQKYLEEKLKGRKI